MAIGPKQKRVGLPACVAVKTMNVPASEIETLGEAEEFDHGGRSGVFLKVFLYIHITYCI